MKPFAAALFTLLVLTGCGQKGPLYIPEDTASVPAQSLLVELAVVNGECGTADSHHLAVGGTVRVRAISQQPTLRAEAAVIVPLL